MKLNNFLITFLAIAGFIIGIYLVLSKANAQEPELLNPHIKTEFIRNEQKTTKTVEKVKFAKVTAYSCIGLKTDQEIAMNCPSLRFSESGMTATGTTPQPYKTVACDRANLGRIFHLEGIGEVTCEDTGGAILGAGRFDLYVSSVQEAREWGVQEIAYKLVEEN